VPGQAAEGSTLGMKNKTGPKQYLMEHEDEGKRLQLNRDAGQMLEHLKSTGILNLPPSPVLVDAGSGSGFVSSIVVDMLSSVFQKYELYLLDFSKNRLDEAKVNLGSRDQGSCKFVQSNLERIALRNDCVDYVFSTFVFEFLQNPEDCFGELLRILKPGGKLVIIDLDYNCLTHYPMSERLEKQLGEIAKTLHEMNLFDVNVGRKIYH
jgi:ubiquinone/menaquinone biosynthesis C-methylase UbiE